MIELCNGSSVAGVVNSAVKTSKQGIDAIVWHTGIVPKHSLFRRSGDHVI